jgi:transglutaminase-like putative cysteine protease
MIHHVTHTTTYAYTDPVSLCHNVVHLVPRDGPNQKCLQNQLMIDPLPAVASPRTDSFGNHVSFFTIQEPHRELKMTSVSVVKVEPGVVPEPAQTPPWEEVCTYVATDRSPPALEACQFLFDSFYIKESADLAGYAAPSFPAGRPVLEAVLDLTRRIHADFRYDRQATTVATPLSKVLIARRGVCQDFAHLQIGCLRSLGLAARYVSGYLVTQPPPGQPRLVGVDASHAWLAFFCTGYGWIDMDPTNQLIPSDKHVTLAWGRDYDDVSPIKGVILGGGEHSVSVGVDVVPLAEAGE